jgi:hypothetical protein
LTRKKVKYIDFGLTLLQLATLACVIYLLKGLDWKGLRLFFAAATIGCLFLAFTRRTLWNYLSLFLFLFIAIHFNRLEFSVGIVKFFQTIHRHYFYFMEPTFDDFLLGRFITYLSISTAAVFSVGACDILWRACGWVLRMLSSRNINSSGQ